MIGRNQILKLAEAKKPLHCVEFDFGPKQENGMGGLVSNHYATKAQAEKEVNDSMWKDATKPRYYTRAVTAEEMAQAKADYFFILL